jgi:hypothetical protein
VKGKGRFNASKDTDRVIRLASSKRRLVASRLPEHVPTLCPSLTPPSIYTHTTRIKKSASHLTNYLSLTTTITTTIHLHTTFTKDRVNHLSITHRIFQYVDCKEQQAAAHGISCRIYTLRRTRITMAQRSLRPTLDTIPSQSNRSTHRRSC